MNRFILSMTAIAAMSALASAQCFEANFGTSIGLGDDTLLAVTPMNITFPMGGIATSYTHVQPNTNGVIYLTNGAAGVGTSATGYSTVAATMVTNLRGVAGNSPRIAVYWRDLNLTAANGAGVFVNNTIPGKCVVTWKNAVHFGQTTPIFTAQAQLWADGHVDMFYSATAQNTATCPIVGISSGNAIADPLASNLATGATSTTKIMYQTFATANTFAGFQNKTISFFPNGGGGYTETMAACVPAANSNYGSGCYNQSGTVYENFPANTVDLSGASIHMTPTGSGYAFSAGTGTNFTHTVPGLGLTDDSVGTLALPVPFNYAGGSTSTLSICSNGYIWMQSPNTLADFSPTAAELFSNPTRLCPMWCDGLPDGATNIQNVFAEVDVPNNKAYVTWANVPIFGGVGGTMNVQVEFNLTSGEIEMRYGAISCGNVSIVGWAPGIGLSTLDVGSRDISATLAGGFVTTTPEVAALALAGSPAPVLGSTLTWTTSNIPAGAVISGHLLSFGQINPGVDLGFLGAPGCLQLVDLSLSSTSLLIGGPTATNSFTIPNVGAYAGATLYAQSVSLVPGANALGAITSNGVKSFINSF